jgi:hypothetical protein
MKVITAPEYYVPTNEEIAVFLAGGITNCEDWQQEVIDYLKSLPEEKTDKLVIYNPRRDKWPKSSDTEEIRRQINWEADYIRSADIFTMYFTNTEKSDQPICFYELGKYANNNTDIISYQEGFKRALDVEFQMSINRVSSYVHKNITPVQHAKLIFKQYKLEAEFKNGTIDEDDECTYRRPSYYRARRK